jgi:cellulose synthase (UDP-forming)
MSTPSDKPKNTAENRAESGRSRRYKDSVLSPLRKKNRVLYTLTLLAGIVYLQWLFRVLDWGHPVVAGLFVLAELICFVCILVWADMLSEERLHPPEGMDWNGEMPDVDLLITVCFEPIEVVRPTLEAVAKIDYPRLHVMVLDDGHSTEVKDIAETLGFGYSARKERTAAKGGNLNHGMGITSSPFVMTLDADQVPHPEIIHRMIGYFQIPKIGFVGSRQSFDVPPHDPWGNRDTVFYEAMQISKNAHNASISCGSGVIYRRKAVEEIGGFCEWSLVEDLHSSMLLADKGWNSVYYPFALTKGTAPTDIFAQQQQRRQWATDSVRILFWDNPFFRKGLKWHQKVSYFHFGYHYIMFGIGYPIFFFMPIWALFTGDFVLTAPLWLFLVYRMPYLGLMRWMNSSMTNHTQDMQSFQVQAGLWFVYLEAILTALVHPKVRPRYRVNYKVRRQISFFARCMALLPNLVLIGLSLAATLYGFLQYWSRPTYLWIHVFWCCWAIFAVSRATAVGLFPSWFMKRK